MHKYLRPLLAAALASAASASGSPAQAQMGLGMGIGIPDGGAKVQPPYSFPATNLYALYSTRKALSTYGGKAVNVTRLSDSTTSDIGFAGADFDTAGFNSFCGGTLCFVNTRYDQSGNGRNLTQATLNNMPYIQVINGKAYLSYAGSRLNYSTFFPNSGDLTIGMANAWVGGAGNASGWLPINNFDGTNGYFTTMDGLNNANPGEWTFEAEPGNLVVATTGAQIHNRMVRMVVTRASSAGTIYTNGVSQGTAANVLGSPITTSNFAIGQLPANTAFGYQGTESETFIYSAALSGTNLSAIDASQAGYFPDLGFAIPFSGSVAGIQAQGTQGVNAGAVLQFENTQPWTAYSAFQMWGGAMQGVVGGIIFTSVANSTAVGGYEMWVDNTCHLVVRVIHDFGGNQYADVRSNQQLCDFKKHFVAAKYTAATKTAADITLYIDCANAASSVKNDTLAGLTLTPASQNFSVDTQYGSIPLAGVINFFQLDKVAQSDAYINSHCTAGNFPAANGGGSPGVSYTFQAGSGTTATDGSGNGFTGTLTSAAMWVP